MRVEVDRETLAILLEYAYRGEAAEGGECRNDRDEHCAMCRTLTEAEHAIGPDEDRNPNWWHPTLRERLRRLVIRWRRRHLLRLFARGT